MLKFAIVGNIASGKSTIELELSKSGFKVFDTDKLSHVILEELKNNVIEAFKGFDIIENSEISRKKLGKIVFENKDLKQKLENIIYPKLKDKILEIFNENKSEKVVFISIPLLFEVGWQDLFDKILFVQTDDNIRLKRLMERNSYSEKDAKARISAQIPQEEKIKKSDFIICNNGTLKILQNQIERFIIQLEEME
mgnify:CR=1 FL=1